MKKDQTLMIRQNIAMAALLHDIGKFYQRAETHAATDKSEYLSGDIIKQMNSICGSHWSHKHALWTAQFLSEYENYIYSNPIDPSVYSLASYHHNADKLLEKIIKYADWISSGIDRRLEENNEELQRSYNFRKQKLMPVFDSLFEDDRCHDKKYRYKLQTLTTENAFPEETDDNKELYAEYKQLWGEFTGELKNIPKNSFETVFETLSALLKKYTWCIPSSTIDRPDISLHDHMKSTSAIGLVMFDYLNDRYPGEINNHSSRIADQLYNNKEEKFIRLICGDISGIQNFIYQIGSSKANVSLKGRSFAVQLICDISAQVFLKELGLNSSNLIYSSGGNFYILAPNTPNTDKKLKEIQLKINKGLYKRYKGELYLSLGSSTFSAQDLLVSTVQGDSLLGEKWQKAISSAGDGKLHKFRDLMLEDNTFFEPFGLSEKTAVCSICGNDEDPDDIQNEEDQFLCRSCREFIDLGQKLRNANYLYARVEDNEEKQLIPGIPLAYYPESSGDIIDNNIQAISALNNTDFLPEKAAIGGYIRNFIFYGGNRVPMTEERVASFSELAGPDPNFESDFSRLSVVRMDVDYLGHLFKNGFTYGRFYGNPGDNKKERSYYSLSRLSTLSSMLDYFFSGHVNYIHHAVLQFSDHVQIVYSGGDDLFFVGRWDAALDMAIVIRNEFKKFTAYHPRLTLSGGMAIVTNKFPVACAADLAGASEKDAKNLVSIQGSEIKEKDAFSILGKAVHWHDLEIIKFLKDDIVHLTEKSDSRGLLSRLRTLYLSYEEEKRNISRKTSFSGPEIKEMIEYGKWRWRLIYNMARFSKETFLEDPEKDLIGEIQLTALEGKSYRNMNAYCNLRDYLDVPVRWAELELRQKGNNRHLSGRSKQ